LLFFIGLLRYVNQKKIGEKIISHLSLQFLLSVITIHILLNTRPSSLFSSSLLSPSVSWFPNESINQYLANIKKDPEKHQARVEVRRCFINTDSCNLSFFKNYWSSKNKIFYIYIKLSENSRFEYLNRSVLSSKSKPIDQLGKQFGHQLLHLLDKHSLVPVNFTNNFNLKSVYQKKVIISNAYILFWSWLIITTFISFVLNVTTVLFSYISYYYLYAYLRSNTHAVSVYNITSIVALYLIILNDSLIVSICYSQSRKQIANSKANVTERSKKITNSTFRQSFYYIVPKNLAFLFILFVSYLNQIEVIQKFSLLLIILLLSYMVIGFSVYSLAILFLSNYHHKFWYKHQIKICDADLNQLIKKLFSDHIPFLVTRFKIFWLLIFTGMSLLSLFLLFHYPKFALDNTFVSSKTKNGLKILIVWGSKIQHYNQEIGSLLSVDMEADGLAQFDQMMKLCDYLGKVKQPPWISRLNCFSLGLYDFLLNLSTSKNIDQIESLANVEKRLADPIFKHHESQCMPKNLHLAENVFTKCIRWWSLKVVEYEANQGKEFKSSPVFLKNRLIPSLYYVQIETNVAIEELEFESVQLIFNSIESWWKDLVLNVGLNENFVWWTSEQLENYFFQKKSNQQLLLTSMVSLIILLAITLYSCSKLVTSLCVYVTIVSSLWTISALLVCLDFKINLYNINLFILQIILTSQYSIFKGVSLRYAPHVHQQNCIIWSFSNVGLSMLVHCLVSCLGSLPLLASSVKFYSSLGKVVLISNVVSYLYSVLFLPSLLSLSSRHIFDDFFAKFKRNQRNTEYRITFGRQASTSSFAPSIVYSHARTISTYLESDLTDIGEYRRRTLSRCSTGVNSHKNSISGWYSNAGRSSLSNQNPNYLQIPRVSRNSVRRISTQSRRSSMMHSRRLSNVAARRNSKKPLDSEDKATSNLSIPINVNVHGLFFDSNKNFIFPFNKRNKFFNFMSITQK
ncbi:dispatched -like protein, partial [Brachionus plicatilis]